MADNVTLNTGSGGDDIAADQIPITSGPKFQRIKLIHGIDGTNDGDVATANPLPVDVREIGGAAVATGGGVEAGCQRVTIASDSTGQITIDGTVTADAGSNLNTSGLALETGGNLAIVADASAVDGAVYGNGILIQGDDGTSRKNIKVDPTTGDVQVDVTNTVTVDGSATTQPVSAASLPLPTGAATSANQTTIIGHVDGVEALLTTIDVDTSAISAGFVADAGGLGNGVLIQGADGTDRKNINVDATTGDVQVDVTNTVTVDNTGLTDLAAAINSNRMDCNVSRIGGVIPTLTAGATDAGTQRVTIGSGDTVTVDLAGNNDVVVAGDVAHNGVDSGNPTKIGAKAVNHGATPTAVSASDRTDLYANRSGVQFVIGGHPNTENLYQNNTAAQTNQVLKAVGVNEKFVVTGISATCDGANTVDVAVTILLGTSEVWGHPGIVAGGGATWGDGSGILAIGAATDDVLLTNEVPTTGSVTVVVTGYLITEA